MPGFTYEKEINEVSFSSIKSLLGISLTDVPYASACLWPLIRIFPVCFELETSLPADFSEGLTQTPRP